MMPLIKTFDHLQIQLEAIKSATNSFDEALCIGSGGFGKVYKGELTLSKGKTMVAVKRLDRIYGQGEAEFWKEVVMLSLYKHENIVSLLGFCDDSKEKILVYEYVSKGSLDFYLDKDDLTWANRLRICIGAARGLAYLHSSVGTQQRVLHRDVKSSNILLDENWNARISDLGLSKFGPANQQFTFLVSHAVGTVGYCDPLYAETGLLTKESDVYSFGVVLFEVFCGRLCIGKGNNKLLPLIGLVRQFYEQNKIDELVFDHIKNEINSNSLKAFASIAYKCLNRDRETRPLMTEIVKELEQALKYQTHDRHQKNYNTTYGKSMTFHFMRSGREMFGLEDLLRANAEVLGKSSLGTTYKVYLSNGSVVVAKNFKPAVIKEGIKVDFHAHMMLLGSMSHPNLLPYVACYYEEGMKKLLITDFAVNGSMASHLHVALKDGDQPGLDWPTRLRIIQGVTRGLDFLNQQFPDLSLPHGHLSSSNVLLDDAFNPLLADYALAPILKKNTVKEYMKAYKSPEFTQHNQRVTKKTDIWCLGILILEMLTGKSPINYLEQAKSTTEQEFVTWVNSIGRDEWTDKVFDKGMKWTKKNEIEMIDLMEIGLHCCESDVSRRWDMRKVFEKIQGLRETENEEEYLSDSREDTRPGLDWPTRLKIIQGVARGLSNLHQQFPGLSLPHGHLSSPNVLFDSDCNPLLADYALAPIIQKEAAKAYMKAYKSHEFTKHKQRVTKKTDVWCFGILILEMLTGVSLLDYLEQGKSTEHDLVTWVNSIGREEWTNKLFDKGMKWTKNNEIEMIDLMEIGLHCCESDVVRRWDMTKVCEKIQGLRETENEEEYLPDSSEE
ncbi:mitogen-activated protein (MAP) kinase kinase kinase 10 [Artemisia annua]|uniref:Mitogen-activated protein (MAP) kinase kinase kinase 10 n=1 Tax=Artemisia annua TaxID=35608 RepID=A0A2U1LUV8_ARTAN|nr:mitogen-activated protein (MAP) kinase kinase kinase 10 [Artemisia annua]